MSGAERKRKRRTGRLLVMVLILAVGAIYGQYWMKMNVPSKIKLLAGAEGTFDFSFPIEASISEKEAVGVLYVNQKPLTEDEIHIDLSQPFSISSDSLGTYHVDLKLFGWIPLKGISLEIIEETELIPGGSVIGLQIETDGILVLGTGEVTLRDGSTAEPAKGLLKSGDYIIGVNGSTEITRSMLVSAIEEGTVCLTIKRDGIEREVSILPVQDYSGKNRIGTWIRTDAQGIGTITYMTTDGKFGALGHGITDIDTGLVMHISGGTLYDAEVLSVIKGKSGSPGELIGILRQSGLSRIGTIELNCAQGIYGQVKLGLLEGKESIPIGLKQEIRLGSASILCQVDSVVKEYEIEIEKIELGRTSDNKGMVIHITDEELLSKTGGIVQGMSGSPIIQDGKIVGAVTHVLVNDPTRGYGIFIENMLEH